MTPSAPRFSIIMNAYNGDAFIRTAIDSVLAQTFQNWELIVWDDGSKDGTVAICRSYTDPRIRMFVSETNLGLGAAKSLAIGKAVGEWVASLDQDDIWTPDKLEAQDALIKADRTGRLGMVYGRTQRFDDSGPIGPFDPWYGTGPLPEGEIFEALLARPSFITLSALVLKRDVLTALGPVPEHIRFCTDYYLSVMTARDHTAACVQTLCCHYRVHPNSMTHVFRRHVHEEILFIVEAAARPAQRHILRRRRLVHNTWIGVEEFRSGQRGPGIARIIRRGSVPYLLLRPLVLYARRLRHRMRLA
jgi:glycosyltransferase involved in cell wall biosynthesis